ncbi:response regulator transcription factor [Heliobacterium chlorum]|uniref:Stage 0 sporulation protein A homolog n=1 Tax=Heliobacterium chlorum TaxID=2698 RepID=A0ABR7T0A1_HELCL|nr:LytTR family DNA-binding domain-containing protein [Heliobacterium chlorum]MBC9783612.1 response regulator transcription factor [Heliobacterium chlorum]
MPIRTLIVDDEAPARRELRFLLEKLPECQVIGEACSGEEALDFLSTHTVDVLFLDIQMHDMDGLMVARRLLEQGRLPFVVFATAFDAYALQAFEVRALDYLLKPFDPQRLETTWQQIQERMLHPRGLEEQLGQLRSLLLSKSDSNHEPKDHGQVEADPPSPRLFRCVAANKNGKMLLVDTAKILYATVEGRKAVVKVDDERLELNLTLQELEDRLDANQFCRTHRAYLVNISAIREIIPWFNGAYNLILHDQSEVPVSRHYAKALKELLGL